MSIKVSKQKFLVNSSRHLVWDHETTPQEFKRSTQPRSRNKPNQFRQTNRKSLFRLLTSLATLPFRLLANRVVAVSLIIACIIGTVGYIGMRIPTEMGSHNVKTLPLKEVTSRLAALRPKNVAELTHRIKSGETLSSISKRYNFSPTEAQEIHRTIESIRKAKKLNHPLRPGASLSVKFDSAGIQELSIPTAIGQTLFVSREADGHFTSKLHELPRKRSERIASGVINSSFAEAALNSGLSYGSVDDLVDLFSDRVVFHRDFRKGNRFSVMYAEDRLADGTVVSTGEIIGASLEVNNKTFYAIRFVGSDGKARYFDKEGNLLGNAFLRYPLKFSRISSLFTTSRFHPVLKTNRPHNGVDFAAPTGTPVRSVAHGKVSFAGRNKGAGIMVKIEHSDRYATAYMHLSRLAPGIRNGALVQRGDVIGAVGSTGLATGPHLHFSFYDRGKYVDPLKIDLPTVNTLASGQTPNKAYLLQTIRTLDKYLAVPSDRLVLNIKLPASTASRTTAPESA